MSYQYYALGRYEEALPLVERSLSIREQELGANHPDTALGLNNLAALYYAQGQYAEAEAYLSRALTIFETLLGSEHPNTQTLKTNIMILQAQMR